MPAGAAVVRYAGKRGVVFRVKYLDADGRQVMETLGPNARGGPRRKLRGAARAARPRRPEGLAAAQVG